MLKGIDPLLTGDLLRALDQLGHSDTVVITDAHFPAYRIGADATVLDIHGSTSSVTRAILSVIDLDNESPVTLMDSNAPWNDAQREIVTATGVEDDDVVLIDRYAFYQAAAVAPLLVRTTETRIYANTILSKGVTSSPPTRMFGE